MAAAKKDIYIEQGSSFWTKLVFKDSLNVAIDLTGSTFSAKLRKYLSDATETLTFTCALLDQTTNTGEIEVTLTAVQTAAITLKAQKTAERVPEQFCWDIEQTFPSGKVKRILEGVALVSPEVTK